MKLSYTRDCSLDPGETKILSNSTSEQPRTQGQVAEKLWVIETPL